MRPQQQREVLQLRWGFQVSSPARLPQGRALCLCVSEGPDLACHSEPGVPLGVCSTNEGSSCYTHRPRKWRWALGCLILALLGSSLAPGGKANLSGPQGPHPQIKRIEQAVS